MRAEKRIYISVFWIIIGLVLVGCGMAEILDSFWSGMGGALIGVGVIRTVQFIKYSKNPEYREKIETNMNDERNKFISGRAWAWSGYAFVILSAIGTIAFKIAGNDLFSQFCGYAVCLILVLYWVIYLFLNKKY